MERGRETEIEMQREREGERQAAVAGHSPASAFKCSFVMLSSAKKLIMMIIILIHCNGYCSATLFMLTCIGLRLRLQLALASSQQVSSNTSTASCSDRRRRRCLQVWPSSVQSVLAWLGYFCSPSYSSGCRFCACKLLWPQCFDFIRIWLFLQFHRARST